MLIDKQISKYLIILTKKFGIEFTGATVATQNFLNYWKSHFEHIIVITLEYGTCEKNNQIKIVKVKNSREIARCLAKVSKLLGTKSYYSDDHLGYLFHNIGVRYVHTYHGNWPDARFIDFSFFIKSFYFIPSYKKTIGYAGTVVNVSHYMEKFTKRFNQSSVVIHNGIQQKSVAPLENNVQKDFLMVGNVDKRKYVMLINLLSEPVLKSEKFGIDIYGKVFDQKIASILNKDTRIHFMGQQSSIDYRPYKAMLYVSTMENLSISACESILSGTPVVSFAIGGLPEVVINGRTGWIFPPYDTKAMADTMIDIFHQEKKQTDAKLLSDFDWKVAADKYLDIFEKLIR